MRSAICPGCSTTIVWAHDRHDLLRRVRRVAHPLVARRAPRVIARQRRRRAPPPRRVEQNGHGSSSDRTADTGAALHGRRRRGYRSPRDTDRRREPKTGTSRRPVLVRLGRLRRAIDDSPHLARSGSETAMTSQPSLGRDGFEHRGAPFLSLPLSVRSPGMPARRRAGIRAFLERWRCPTTARPSGRARR
jgi:hypothetical protein